MYAQCLLYNYIVKASLVPEILSVSWAYNWQLGGEGNEIYCLPGTRLGSPTALLNNPPQWLLLFSLSRWGNWRKVILRNWPKITQLISDRGRNRLCLSPTSMILSHLLKNQRSNLSHEFAAHWSATRAGFPGPHIILTGNPLTLLVVKALCIARKLLELSWNLESCFQSHTIYVTANAFELTGSIWWHINSNPLWYFL